MKNTKLFLVTLLLISFITTNAQWKQNNFVIGGSATTPFANASSSGILNLTQTNAEYQADILAYKKIYDCHFNLLLDPMANDLNRTWSMKSDWSNYQFPKASSPSYVYYNGSFAQFVSQDSAEARRQREYVLKLVKTVSSPSKPLQVMVSDNALFHYPVNNPLTSPQNWVVANPPKNWFSNSFLNDPFVLGINSGDEPDLVPTVSPDYNKLVYFSNIFNDNYFLSRGISIKPLWVNMSGGYAGVNNPGFEFGISRLKSINPKIVSADSYPFKINATSGVKFFVGAYFYILSHFRKTFLNTSNFWYYIHTASTDGGLPLWIENTNYQQLQFSAFCPIAYGAKGILYWPVDGNYFRNAPTVGTGVVDNNTKYNDVKRINNYVENIVGPIVMNNKNIAALNNNTYLPPADGKAGSRPWTSNIPYCDNRDANPQAAPVVDFPVDEKLLNYKGIIKEVSAEDILVGVFSNAQQDTPYFVRPGDYYLLVVNKDTYGENGYGTTQLDLVITLNGRHDGLSGSTKAKIYKGVDAYNDSPLNPLQDIQQTLYNELTKETYIIIDVLKPGEGRMVKLSLDKSVPTGISEATTSSFVKIVPNPLKSQATVHFSNEQKNATIKIIDVSGKEVRSFNCSDNQFQLEKGNLKAGYYFIQITKQSGNVLNEKLIIQ
jgi:hypothetical protein